MWNVPLLVHTQQKSLTGGVGQKRIPSSHWGSGFSLFLQTRSCRPWAIAQPNPAPQPQWTDAVRGASWAQSKETSSGDKRGLKCSGERSYQLTGLKLHELS